MKIFLFFISTLLLLAFWPRNEMQKQAWNRFWAIREAPSQQESHVNQGQAQQQYTVIQRPITNNNLNNTSTDNLNLYRLQKKALGGPFGETQFEYILRRW